MRYCYIQIRAAKTTCILAHLGSAHAHMGFPSLVGTPGLVIQIGRWQELRRDTLRRLRRALNGGLWPPNFQKRSIPRASWDLAFCREIENVHFPPSPFYGPGCSGGRELSGAWRRRNPARKPLWGGCKLGWSESGTTPRYRWVCPVAGSLGLLGLCNCFWALLACTCPSKRQRCAPM